MSETEWFDKRFNRLIDDELTAAGKDPAREKIAAERASKHFDTPSVQHFDTLGRPVLQIENNRDISGADIFYKTEAELDIEGNLRSVTDARGNQVMQYKYDMLGNQVYQNSRDAGQRWLIANIAGNPLRNWDERNHTFSFKYDVLHRPTAKKVEGGDGAALLNNICEKIIYGETLSDPKANNLRGQAVIVYDTSGKSETSAFDFKGNPLRTVKTFARNYKEVADWSGANPDADLEQEIFVSSFEYDALNRIIRQTAPDDSIFLPDYNEAGLLDRVRVTQNGNTEFYVRNIDYNEKRQRNRIRYGNNVTTNYFYDDQTFRLIRLETKRQNNDPLQDLQYTFDPVGNITHVADRNIPAVFFNNQKIEAAASYTYDAIYRLVAATGREHMGQPAFNPKDNWKDTPFIKKYNFGDSFAWRNYEQTYIYDSVGNILQIKHQAAGNNWTRDYTYETTDNRLKTTQVDNQTYIYPHHTQHGFMISMPHLQIMNWNFKDELQAVSRQKKVDGGVPETTYYVYDARGERSRKITEIAAEAGKSPTVKSERLYLGGFEIYRKHSGVNADLERQTLHIMDDAQRIAMIETRNEVDDGTSAKLIRYQLTNNLGSSGLEIDHLAQIISYEEYYPYGTTSYQAARNQTETYKRYRYTGKERDEESGFYYHGARYYTAWLCRWISADPLLFEAANDVRYHGYLYVDNRPIIATDPSGKVLWLVAGVAIAITALTSISAANAPTSKSEAQKAEASVSNAEFAAHTTLNVLPIGGARGGATLAQSVGRGAAGGAVTAPAHQAVRDLATHQLSSPGTYARSAVEGAAAGAAVGVGAHVLGKVSRAISARRQARNASLAETAETEAGSKTSGSHKASSGNGHTSGELNRTLIPNHTAETTPVIGFRHRTYDASTPAHVLNLPEFRSPGLCMSNALCNIARARGYAGAVIGDRAGLNSNKIWSLLSRKGLVRRNRTAAGLLSKIGHLPEGTQILIGATRIKDKARHAIAGTVTKGGGLKITDAHWGTRMMPMGINRVVTSGTGSITDFKNFRWAVFPRF